MNFLKYFPESDGTEKLRLSDISFMERPVVFSMLLALRTVYLCIHFIALTPVTFLTAKLICFAERHSASA